MVSGPLTSDVRMMNIRSFILLGALAFGASCSHKSTFQYQTPTGETIILKQTSTPGFLDPSITREFFIQWTSGKKERLPTVWFLHEGHHPRVVQTNDLVWIISDRGLLARKGTPRNIGGEWHQWEVRPSDELFQFLFEYASAHQFIGVTTSSYTQSLRTGPLTVHESAMETNMTLHYAASPRDYFISQTDKQGFWLPPHRTQVDFDSHRITVSFSSPPEAMPTSLVFTTLDRGFDWRFDRTESRKTF